MPAVRTQQRRQRELVKTDGENKYLLHAQLLAFGRWLLAFGYWLLAIGFLDFFNWTLYSRRKSHFA